MTYNPMSYEAIAKVIHARRRAQQIARHTVMTVDVKGDTPPFVYLSWDEMCLTYREDLIAEVMLVIDMEDV